MQLRISRSAAYFLCFFWLELCGFIKLADAVVMYNVTFDDPNNQFAAFYDDITTNVVAAGTAWSSHFVGDAPIEVQIHFDDIPTAAAASATTSLVKSNGGINFFEQGATTEVRTGMDPNGVEPDAVLTIGTGFLRDDLWFDPAPTLRTSDIPFDRVDAFSVFLHEFGHIYAFNGFRDPFTGLLPADFASTYDERVIFDGENFFFIGPFATAIYGSPVPVTFGNYAHVANQLPRPGSDLIPDLMNGVVFFRQTRYDISLLDLAIFADVGVPLNEIPALTPVPEASTLLLLGLGGLCCAVCMRWRSSS